MSNESEIFEMSAKNVFDTTAFAVAANGPPSAATGDVAAWSPCGAERSDATNDRVPPFSSVFTSHSSTAVVPSKSAQKVASTTQPHARAPGQPESLPGASIPPPPSASVASVAASPEAFGSADENVPHAGAAHARATPSARPITPVPSLFVVAADRMPRVIRSIVTAARGGHGTKVS